MPKPLLERLAQIASAAVLVVAVWFWINQINNVLETLKLAYG